MVLMNLHSTGGREAWADVVPSDLEGSPHDLDPAGSQASDGEAVASLESVTCGYRRQPVFRDLTLRLQAGQLAGLVGPTGSGKTTLLKALLGLVRPWQGKVRVFGASVSRATRARIGYVPQLETLDWQFPVTAEQVVLMGAYRGMSWLPWCRASERWAAFQLMEQLGIAECVGQHIRELSGGQQQRVFLARALLGKPQLLILDEPTVGVDLKTQHDILHLLESLSEQGITILLTTHDLNAVAAHLPWLICFNRGVIAQGPPELVFTSDILRATYASEMLVLRQHGYLLVANSPLVYQGRHGDQLD
jgi:zinc/manganese transport system ATP-binding protein/zinc transport system ATP-binding protein